MRDLSMFTFPHIRTLQTTLFATLMSSSLAVTAYAETKPKQPPSQPVQRTTPQKKKATLSIPPTISAKTGKTVDVYHGVKVADPYRWLENGKSKKVVSWGARHQARTRAFLDKIPARKNIIKELKKLYNNTSSSSPQSHGNRYFFFRREGLKNQPILYVREGRFDAPARVLLDPNTMSKDGTVAIQQISPSPSGRFLAYAVAAKGSDWSHVKILNVQTKTHLSDTIPRTRWPSIVWNRHGTGFYYVSYPPKGSVPKRDRNYYRRIFFHLLGTSYTADRLVFGGGYRKEAWVSPATTSDRDLLFVSKSTDWSRNDLYIRPMDGKGPFLPFAVGLKGQFSVDADGDTLYIMTTYKAPKGRILIASKKKWSQKHWKTLLPEQRGVIKSVSLAKGMLLVHYMEDVASRLAVYSRKGKFLYNVPLPAKGTVGGLETRHDRSEIFFRFTSWIYPSVGYRFDLKTRKRTQLESLKIPVDLSKYTTKQIFYKSKDGTRVPMFLVYRKGLVLNGNNPTELYGYGGFEVSLRPRFLAALFPWLDRGGVFALANLRGGGEYGSAWHKAGRRAKKQNVNDDFIAAAEWLIKHKYTRSKRLSIRGGSNGGLLVSAVMTQRPDLFGAVICQVPLTDMIRYPISTVARLWIPEYGDPKKANEFKWVWSYSPYHKLKKGVRYPHTLMMTADHDDRVDPFHARKFAARLQASTSKDRMMLLRIESKAGHGAGTPMSKRIISTADRYAFLMWAFGMNLQK